MKRVYYTPLARSDLHEIHSCIATDNPQAADNLIRLFQAKTNTLRDYPETGRMRPECGPGLRSVATGNYVLFYRVTAKIEIVRVVHGARDIPTLFKDRIS